MSDPRPVVRVDPEVELRAAMRHERRRRIGFIVAAVITLVWASGWLFYNDARRHFDLFELYFFAFRLLWMPALALAVAGIVTLFPRRSWLRATVAYSIVLGLGLTGMPHAIQGMRKVGVRELRERARAKCEKDTTLLPWNSSVVASISDRRMLRVNIGLHEAAEQSCGKLVTRLAEEPEIPAPVRVYYEAHLAWISASREVLAWLDQHPGEWRFENGRFTVAPKELEQLIRNVDAALAAKVRASKTSAPVEL